MVGPEATLSSVDGPTIQIHVRYPGATRLDVRCRRHHRGESVIQRQNPRHYDALTTDAPGLVPLIVGENEIGRSRVSKLHYGAVPVSYTHLRAHETPEHLV